MNNLKKWLKMNCGNYETKTERFLVSWTSIRNHCTVIPPTKSDEFTQVPIYKSGSRSSRQRILFPLTRRLKFSRLASLRQVTSVRSYSRFCVPQDRLTKCHLQVRRFFHFSSFFIFIFLSIFHHSTKVWFFFHVSTIKLFKFHLTFGTLWVSKFWKQFWKFNTLHKISINLYDKYQAINKN